jgi:hypothetical protein
MSKCTKHYVTVETLKAKTNSGIYSTEQRNYLLRMSARMSQIGTHIDTVISRTHVAAGSFAMPISFNVPVYGITRQKFAAMLRHLTELPPPIPPRRRY